MPRSSEPGPLRAAALLAAAVLVSGLTACGGSDASGGDRDGRVRVVATTAVAADLARAVGGDRAQVSPLVPSGADPHDFEPRPDDVDALARADLVLRSGGELDEWLSPALESAGTVDRTATLLDRVGGRDPHWWHDPRAAGRAVQAIRALLSEADPAGRSSYERRAAAYGRRLRALDAAIARCLARVPAQRRKLVTSHDSLGPYARRYGIEVVGTVIPSRSTAAQPSAASTAALVRAIRAEGVRTVFAEASAAADVERAIARDSGARLGAALYADGLGRPGTPGDSLLGALAANTRALVEGFTGRPARCRLPGS